MFIPNVDSFRSVSFTVSKDSTHTIHGFFFTCAISQPSQNVSIIGDSFNSSLVAIVSVDPEVMKDWAASEGIKVLSSNSMISSLIRDFKSNLSMCCKLFLMIVV